MGGGGGGLRAAIAGSRRAERIPRSLPDPSTLPQPNTAMSIGQCCQCHSGNMTGRSLRCTAAANLQCSPRMQRHLPRPAGKAGKNKRKSSLLVPSPSSSGNTIIRKHNHHHPHHRHHRHCHHHDHRHHDRHRQENTQPSMMVARPWHV